MRYSKGQTHYNCIKVSIDELYAFHKPQPYHQPPNHQKELQCFSNDILVTKPHPNYFLLPKRFTLLVTSAHYYVAIILLYFTPAQVKNSNRKSGRTCRYTTSTLGTWKAVWFDTIWSLCESCYLRLYTELKYRVMSYAHRKKMHHPRRCNLPLHEGPWSSDQFHPMNMLQKNMYINFYPTVT